MKKLDLYITKKFLTTYFFVIVLVIGIAVVFDINEKLDKFMENDAPVGAIIFDYYMNFVPYYANLFSPLFIFISVIFFTSNLAENSEIIAMLSSGTSLHRLLRPYFFSAGVIFLMNLVLGTIVIPPSNVKRYDFEDRYIKKVKKDYASNIQLQVDTGVIAYFNRYDQTSRMGYQFSLEKFEGKSLKSKLTASSIRYDSLNHWTINNYLIRRFEGRREMIEKGVSMDTIIPIEPSDFLISIGDQEQMTSPALYEYIQKQKSRGIGNIQDFEIEYHRRFSMAFASFILTLIGLSVSARKVKGGMGLNIGIGLGFSFSYIMFITISSSFAVSGLTSPFVAVWIPNILYLLIGLVLYRKAPQ